MTLKVQSALVRSGATAASHEAERLRVLADYVDVAAWDASSPGRAELLAIVRLAAAVAGTQMATVNLLDERLQRQLATVGFEPADCPREDSLCHLTLALGGSVLTEDAADDPRFVGSPWVDGRIGRIRFYASTPLVTPEGFTLGTLCAFDWSTGTLDLEQAARLRDLAELVVAVFDRERRARRERSLAVAAAAAKQLADTARTLQESLLPRRLVGSAHVRVASRYLPGTAGSEVGGDWYDVVRSGSCLVFVVGDVQGHSSGAAALMGQLRTAVRAYLSEGHQPAAALERTNALLVGLDADLFATCALVQLDERTGDLTIASAGHPPPLALAEGRVDVLDVEPGPPLGVLADAHYAERTRRYRSRTRLVLYTDGVTETRLRPGDVGTAALAGLLARAGTADVEGIADALTPREEAAEDDAALLVLDYAGVDTSTREASFALEPDLALVPETRRSVREVLTRWQLDDESSGAIELIVSELATNALVHTGGGARLTLCLEPAAEVLTIGVQDSSSRHPRPRDADDEALGGRGMVLVDALAGRWWVTPSGAGKTVWAAVPVAGVGSTTVTAGAGSALPPVGASA